METKKVTVEKAINLLKTNGYVTGYQIWLDTGITEASISNWRNGRYKPTYANALKIIEYFNNAIKQ